MAVRQTGLRDVVCGKRPESVQLPLSFAHRDVRSRVPFIHFFDGFARPTKSTKLSLLADDTIFDPCRRPKLMLIVPALNPGHL